ncbi:hypothetical protein NE237_015519 [Protea cynaroides]|uniref:Uncharacterized protein n=1 Tax=Protea cynaroides TaxID=273540 RepID=A0A9Q0QR55_9MAGN|nr:hypothetical protein NE237_015519 [Protea cynaroides]
MKRNRDTGKASQMNHPMIDEADPFTFARSYQLDALEKAMKENTIVFLETGSGKTLIAVMLLKNYAYHLRKPSQFIAVLLVPTVVLVNQQAKVVERHTDLKVGKYWGEMGVDYWDAATWMKELDKYELFVMTPQILLDALRHNFFKLEIIKLLIFDECHNARGRSPYACIMTEFYHQHLRSNATQLPRIFGMTASPIKSKGPDLPCVFGKEILELESLMNSKIYTVANESVLAEFIPFSTPKLKFYKHTDILCPLILDSTHCLEGLKNKHLQCLEVLHLDNCFKESLSKKISKSCATLMYCITHLGVWLALKASESLSCHEIDIFPWLRRTDEIGRSVVKSFNRDVYQFLLTYVPKCSIGDNIRANIDAGLLTPKVECLIDSLLEYRMMKDLRCIIFVERVITAVVLKSLLSQLPQLSFWKSEYMAGHHHELHSQNRNDQIKIVEGFRNGLVNIIVATQILEEGLDVQSCNLVIRFDPSVTVCSFIQSRGRARMRGSDYLLFVESGDASTLSTIKKYLASGDIMREQSLRHSSLPCAPLETEMFDEEFYRVESTGAIVTLSSSVALVYFYCSRLPSDGYFRPAPRFIIDKHSKFCTLRLPLSCPVQNIFVQGEINMLRKVACLEACKKLHEIGALTENLLPKLVEDEASAQMIGNISYEDEHDNYFPGELVGHSQSDFQEGLHYCYLIELKRNFEYDVALKDIILVVRCDLELGSMNYEFDLEIDRGSVTVNIIYSGTMHLNPEQVLTARRFHITFLRMLLASNLGKVKDAIDGLHQESSCQRIDYLLLPRSSCHLESSIIDWDCVRSAWFSCEVWPSEIVQVDHKHSCTSRGYARRMQTKNGVMCSCILENSLVVTPHNGHIYCINGILFDLDGNSPMRMCEDLTTYKRYYQLRHGIELHYDGEPLLYGRHTFTVKNRLQSCNSQKNKERSTNYVELPAELCSVILSPISIDVCYSFSLVPSIMHRLESLLIAVNLKKLLSDHFTHNAPIPASKVLEAITTKGCQEEISLESLETLGDSFLKYVTCRHLFSTNIHHHEGLLSAQKDRMISNTVLCKLGCERKLPGFIRTEFFDPKLWLIPGDQYELDVVLLSTMRKIYSKGKRKIKSKVVADVVEALIGVYLSTCGELAALLFMDWLGMKVDLVNVPYERPFLAHPERHINISYIGSQLKYSFHEPALLVEALTHGSYMFSEIPRCYQRLEFLGDSVLDYLITTYFYEEYPGIFPGQLTDLRSATVNNECYARAVVKAGLYKHVLHASSELHNQITSADINFEQSSLGSTFGWDSETDFPKVFGDILESLAGAVLVDSGYDHNVVWETVKPLLEPMVTPDTVELNPVRELHELRDRRSYEMRKAVLCEGGVTYVTIEVKAEGTTYQQKRCGRNKKTAKKLAAKAALKSLEETQLHLGTA